MRKLLLILIITLPTILVGQDLRHWFPEEFENLSEELIPKSKIALVIGNTNYEDDIWDLKNPTNDANLIATSFKELNFKVILRENLNKKQFLDAIKEFKEKQEEYDFSIIYYAGHAIQDENSNSYILPVDFSNKKQIESAAFNITELVNYFEKSEKKCLLILDACRNTGNNGLPKPLMEDPKNVKLAYSTSFGNTASDDSTLDNTIYTHYLSKLFLIDGLRIKEILDNASKFVLLKTEEKQNPTHYFGAYVRDIQLTNPK